MTIRIVSGDITTFTGDVIVNAANNQGLGGGGVDGAIHRAAGPGLRNACMLLPLYRGQTGLGPGMTPTNEVRIPTGKVVPTLGFGLPASWIFHTAGPVFSEPTDPPLPGLPSYDRAAAMSLTDCYRNALRLTAIMGVKSIALPAISAGVYGCPMDLCARIALNCAWNHLNPNPDCDVSFYIFPAIPNFDIWRAVAQESAIQITTEEYKR